MKTILNYGLTYHDAQGEHDAQYFGKKDVIKEYLLLLESRREISNLSIYQWEGVRTPVKKDITSKVNLFLSR